MKSETANSSAPPTPNKRKREKRAPHESLVGTYIEMWGVLTLPNILNIAFILLTYKLSFAASDLLSLKLLEKGMTKDTMAVMSVVRLPFTLGCPILVRKWTMGGSAKPLSLWTQAFPYRLVLNITAAILVYTAPDLTIANYATYRFYFLFFINALMKQITVEIMHSARGAFYTRVADDAIGGTYLTLLNTISNLGIKWPHTVALGLMDAFSVNKRRDKKRADPLLDPLITSPIVEVESIWYDGYYTLTVCCTIFGILWLYFMKKKVISLQESNLDTWKVSHQKPPK